MRAPLIILSLAALVALVTPPLAQVTGDLPSAVTLELMVFITVASFFTGAPQRPRPGRRAVQGD